MGFLYSQFFVTPQIPPDATFADQTVIITGSNVGLGLEAARHITRLNAAKVILAVRNVAAGQQAKESIETTTGRRGVCEVWELDLASYDSVKSFAARATSNLPRLDIVVENAGVATETFSLAEGHEKTITVNVISTFLLALLLLPKLQETAKKFPRGGPKASSTHLCIVSSEVHAWVGLPKDSSDSTGAGIFRFLDNEKASDMKKRYPMSKLLEVLIVREIAPKLANPESNVILNMLNPGFCHSQLTREAGCTLWIAKMILARSTEVGSRTLVAAAAVGEESHGAYMTDAKVDNGALSTDVKSEKGKDVQKKLWSELKEILEEIQPGVTRVLG